MNETVRMKPDWAAGDNESEDPRGAARVALLIRPAKLISGRFEYPCVMRDVSETGVSVRLFHPIGEHEAWEIEMLGGERHAVEQIWLDGLAAGFRSD